MVASTRATRSQAVKRAGAPVKQEEDVALASTPKKRKLDANVKQESAPSSKKSKTKAKSGKQSRGPSDDDLKAGAQLAATLSSTDEVKPDLKTSPSKKSKYNLSPGVSPYPAFPHPTPEECEEVNRLLGKAHGAVSAPKTIPAPSLNSSGCGEVPSVLDALVRTRLSANTNNANSSRAFRGLVDRFGLIKAGIGKGSVDWNKVRKTDVKELFEAIKSGGLAGVKSKDIKAILDLVHEENKTERKQNGEKETGDHPLSLDHLHGKSNEDAFDHLVQYPGIGPKTASCVLLFCMQRPSFAVDTHVFRLTRWLGWLPTDQQVRGMAKRGQVQNSSPVKNGDIKKEEEDEGNSMIATSPSGQKVRIPPVSRETAYAHMDVRVPDHLKYPLHYLLIRHGKTCGWCSAKAGAAAKVGTCPLAHLMKGKGKNKGLAKKEVKEEDEDENTDEDEESEVNGEEMSEPEY